MRLEGVENVKNNIKKYGDQTINKLADGLGMAITEGENTAKNTAPWTDRTGNARNSITGSGPTVSSDRIRTALSIGVHYGKYLELCNFGKYRIVWPTLEWLATRINTYI